MELLKKVVLFLSLVLLLGSVGVSYGGEVRGVTDRSVKIGLMGGMTGPAAEVWVPIAHGLKAFLKKANNEGGVHGRKIEYILEDDRYSIPLALSGFKKLVYKDKIFALQGASGVGHTAAIIPLAEKEKMPLIAASAEKRFFVPARKYIFSVIPLYEDQAKLVFEYVFNDMKLKNPTIALMYTDVGAGKDTRDTVRELAKVYPVTAYKDVPFTMGALDFTSEMLNLKRLKPDVVYIHGYVTDTAMIIKSAYRMGLSSTFIVSQYSCVPQTLEIAGKAATKIAGKEGTGLLGINCFGMWENNSPGVKKLRKGSLAYDPNVHYRDTNFFQGWFVGMLFYEGFKNAGRNLTTETFLNGLEAMKDFDMQGIAGPITLNPNDHYSIKSSRIYKVNPDKNSFVPITDWRKPKKYDF